MTTAHTHISARTRGDSHDVDPHALPAPGKILAFIERHEVFVQLLPFLLASLLVLLSLVSRDFANIIRLLDVTKTK